MYYAQQLFLFNNCEERQCREKVYKHIVCFVKLLYKDRGFLSEKLHKPCHKDTFYSSRRQDVQLCYVKLKLTRTALTSSPEKLLSLPLFIWIAAFRHELEPWTGLDFSLVSCMWERRWPNQTAQRLSWSPGNVRVTCLICHVTTTSSHLRTHLTSTMSQKQNRMTTHLKSPTPVIFIGSIYPDELCLIHILFSNQLIFSLIFVLLQKRFIFII